MRCLYSSALLLWAAVIVTIDGLMFHIPPNGKKCLREKIHEGVLVIGDYESSDAPGQTLELKVRFTCFLFFR